MYTVTDDSRNSLGTRTWKELSKINFPSYFSEIFCFFNYLPSFIFLITYPALTIDVNLLLEN